LGGHDFTHLGNGLWGKRDRWLLGCFLSLCNGTGGHGFFSRVWYSPLYLYSTVPQTRRQAPIAAALGWMRWRRAATHEKEPDRVGRKCQKTNVRKNKRQKQQFPSYDVSTK